MAVDTPATIAVLGAGPIGLEAALYGRFLGYDVQVFERGRVAENVRRWGHATMFTPFRCNCSPLGMAAIAAQDEAYVAPADDECLTGRDWVEKYLSPLAATDLLAENIHEQTDVLLVTRWQYRKGELVGHEDRGDSAFRLLVRNDRGDERAVSADIVIDTTGVYQTPNWMGPGGGPALGELDHRDRIEYGLPVLQGHGRCLYAGKRILLVGSGYSAATNAVSLADIAVGTPSTRVTWVTRPARALGEVNPIPRLANDRLPRRDELARRANALAWDGDSPIEHLAGWRVEAMTRDRFEYVVRLARDDEDANPAVAREERFDCVIANVGYSPDHRFSTELQLRLCHVTDGPMPFAQSLLDGAVDGAVDGALNLPAPGAERLITSEPNFYILGAKSYGRDSRFLFLAGLHQIRDLFSIIGERADLNLYATAKRLRD